jgi:hypothetical protein
MNRRQVSYLVILALLLGFALMRKPVYAQDLGPNLLVNAGFEEGHFHQDGIGEITVPNGWRMHWSNAEKIFGGEFPTARPETVVWNISGAPPDEAGVFWRDGIYTVKIFKGWAPMWAAMSQDVSGLQVGRRYRLVAPVFVDLVESYADGKKVAPSHNNTGRVRLGAGPVGTAWRDEGAIAYSGWWTAETINPFYQAYSIFVHDFTATQANMTVWLEVASSYPYQNNGFFLDTVGLYALNETAAVPNPAPPAQGQPPAPAQPAAPPAAPLPTVTPRADGAVVHLVQPGDTLWAIAFQYAETLDMPAEEALPHIRELNNDPAFITVGQELMIVEPSGNESAGDDEAAATGTPGGEGDGTTTAAATPDESEAATTPEATSEGTAGATPEGSAAATPEEGETALVAPTSESEEPAEEPATEASGGESAGGICVTVYEDASGDGVRDNGEGLLADAAVTLSRAGNTISTYITDGTTEPYCFEVAEADTYQVQIYPPADYVVTGEASWAVAVTEGANFPVSFGLQSSSDAAAVTDVADTSSRAAAAEPADAAAESVADTAAETTAAEETTAAANSGFQMPSLGVIVLGVAVFLVLLAGIGVFLLRRG